MVSENKAPVNKPTKKPLNSGSRAHVDQVRNSLSKNYHIINIKIYEIFQEQLSDRVLFLKFSAHQTVTCTPL